MSKKVRVKMLTVIKCSHKLIDNTHCNENEGHNYVEDCI